MKYFVKKIEIRLIMNNIIELSVSKQFVFKK